MKITPRNNPYLKVEIKRTNTTKIELINPLPKIEKPSHDSYLGKEVDIYI